MEFIYHKKNICIIFPEGTISYSPTIINIVKELSVFCSVEVLCFDTGDFNVNLKNDINIKYSVIKVNYNFYRFLFKFGIHKPYLLMLLFMHILNYKEYDEIIAVDSLALLPASFCFKNIHFLSLEIRKDLYFLLSSKNRIKSLIIQTREREKYLFQNFAKPVFYIHNSPYFKKDMPEPKPKTNQCIKLIYFGNVVLQHAVYELIVSIKNINANCSLTMKGNITPDEKNKIIRNYPDLIQNNKLILDSTYIEDDQIADYLSNFQIGFCFYSFVNITKKNFYNYFTSPSGKLFNYYNAGVPVIGNKILGLQSIEDFKAGILIENLSSENINSSIHRIMRNYSVYKSNARKAAEHFDFKKSALPFINYIYQQ